MFLWTGRDEILLTLLVVFVLFVLPSVMWYLARRSGRFFSKRRRQDPPGKSRVR